MQRGLLPYGSLRAYILSLSMRMREYESGASCMRCLILAGQSGPSTSPSGGFRHRAWVINSLSECVESPTPLDNTWQTQFANNYDIKYISIVKSINHFEASAFSGGATQKGQDLINQQIRKFEYHILEYIFVFINGLLWLFLLISHLNFLANHVQNRKFWEMSTLQ